MDPAFPGHLLGPLFFQCPLFSSFSHGKESSFKSSLTVLPKQDVQASVHPMSPVQFLQTWKLLQDLGSSLTDLPKQNAWLFIVRGILWDEYLR
ncbi:hypothetical protein VitviT2T_009438 [Vitis vinifera]|uniref:Uncharacterized protein n=1 Tax=Vitis vinifera TaxID=29760 RepID=A0ABY9C4U6_VITVI|nr:hypothetical protein VitviT2T_009438 [Vitis vinifera]